MSDRRFIRGFGDAVATDLRQEGPRCSPLRAGQPACCCPAPAFARVLVPPRGQRRRVIDLFLCAHHYRISRPALADLGAVAFNHEGFEITPWSPALVSRHDEAGSCSGSVSRPAGRTAAR